MSDEDKKPTYEELETSHQNLERSLREAEARAQSLLMTLGEHAADNGELRRLVRKLQLEIHQLKIDAS